MFWHLLSDEDGGIIESVSHDVFSLLGEKTKNNEARVRVSYMELYKEELRDLLELQTVHKELRIREDERGNTGTAGVRARHVTRVDCVRRARAVRNNS